MLRIFTNQVKNFCTKVPLEKNSAEAWKNFQMGSKVTVTKTITDEDILNFANLTGDFNPIHTNSPKIVHGAFLNGLVSGVIGSHLPGPGTMVVQQIIRYPTACYAGDTIDITVELVAIRKIIKCQYKCIANTERTVLEGEAKLIYRKPTSKEIIFIK